MQRLAGNRAVTDFVMSHRALERGLSLDENPDGPIRGLIVVEDCLKSERLKGEPRLEQACQNQPVMKRYERNDGVARLQLALIDQGLPMPRSTKQGTAPPDGIYGDETFNTVAKFQDREHLSRDGRAGHDTLTRLDDSRLGRVDVSPARTRIGNGLRGPDP